MINDLNLLSVCYPFMPTGNGVIPDLFKHIKDIRLKIVLPAVDPDVSGRQYSNSAFFAYITSISADQAFFYVKCPDYGYSESVRVPVFLQSGDCPNTDSFVIVDSEQTASGIMYEIHPDCLLFLQEAPSISMQKRWGIRADDSAGIAWETFGDTLRFKNGYNIDVSIQGDTILFYGAQGAGTGVYGYSPFIDVPDMTVKAPIGLRSINGVSGNVVLKTGASVILETTRAELDRITTVKISVKR